MSSRAFSARWVDGAVELVDQTKLPDRYATLRCNDTDDLAQAIGRLQVRGAPAIGLAAAYGVAAAAARAARCGARADRVVAVAVAAAEHLRHVRPTAANLAWACDRMASLARSADGDAHEVAERLLSEARAIEGEDRAACAAMGAHGAGYLARALPRAHGLAVLTHCNTGALCTAGIGTAFGVVRTLFERGKLAQLWIDETRPLLQGARLTAWEALELGMPHTIIADSAAGSLLSDGGVDAVVVGADRIAANGDVANKIGTYPLAVLCSHHGAPFIVVAPTSSIDLETTSGAAVVIEQRAAEEIALARGQTRLAPEGSPVHNPAFDVTPAGLVSALVTEQGVVARPDAQRLAAHLTS
ncbi:MAG: S-methyl-5-thioribose-1-phosphate isomerase [Nitriliruptorales bacterium]